MIAMKIADAVAELRRFGATWDFRPFDCIVTVPGVRRGFHFYYVDSLGSLINRDSFRVAADHFHNRTQD